MGTSVIIDAGNLYVYKKGQFFRLISAIQYAHNESIAPSTALRRAKNGQVEVFKIGRDYFFPETEPDKRFKQELGEELGCFYQAPESDLKKNSDKIFDMIGLSREQAIDLFLRQVILKRGIPFELTLPEGEDSDL